LGLHYIVGLLTHFRLIIDELMNLTNVLANVLAYMLLAEKGEAEYWSLMTINGD
jgi:hypothetical protein